MYTPTTLIQVSVKPLLGKNVRIHTPKEAISRSSIAELLRRIRAHYRSAVTVLDLAMTSLSVEDEEKVNHRTTDEAVTDLIVGSWGQGNMGTLVQPWLLFYLIGHPRPDSARVHVRGIVLAGGKEQSGGRDSQRLI
jgi:hypothetical protein